MPLQATSGAASYDAFGGGVPVVPAYIEEVFSTTLFTGTGATQTITNNIDMTKGYLLWFKDRSAARDHKVYDSARGVDKTLVTNSTAAQVTQTFPISVSTTGFTIPDEYDINTSNNNIVSWTFRKQPKFFDVVTWTGTGSNTTISHSLGSVPACIMVKRTDTTGAWQVYHRSLANTEYLVLNATASAATGATRWNSTTPTSSVFSLGTDATVNASGGTYVAYIFAHDAGGFGLTGTDNVISCGSFTTDGSTTTTVNLGYEPQLVIIKFTSQSGSWYMLDTMRGMNANLNPIYLLANNSGAENTNTAIAYGVSLTSTGFNVPNTSNFNQAGVTSIYVAIRRGPMKVPTSGTSVFSPIAYVGANGAAQNISAGFPVDMDIIKIRNDASRNPLNHARLMGGVFLSTNATGAQQSYSDNIVSFNNAQNVIGLPVTGGGTNEINGASTSTYIGWAMRRAPSFMDVVCYTGNSVQGRTITHNLGVKPELMFVKSRSNAISWQVYSATETATKYMLLDSSQSSNTASFDWNDTEPTSSVFTVQGTGGTGLEVNWTGYTYVAYLFATCAGVSKVGGYTGNGTTQTIDCGFTGGARFVLIKRTDASGDWYVYDTARGMTTLTDPYLLLNTTAAETATLGSVTTVSTGFALNSTILAAINVSGGSYIFFAVA